MRERGPKREQDAGVQTNVPPTKTTVLGHPTPAEGVSEDSFHESFLGIDAQVELSRNRAAMFEHDGAPENGQPESSSSDDARDDSRPNNTPAIIPPIRPPTLHLNCAATCPPSLLLPFVRF